MQNEKSIYLRANIDQAQLGAEEAFLKESKNNKWSKTKLSKNEN